MGEQIKVGDLVWAKMKGFSPWPGKVTLPVDNMKRPKSSKVLHCIFFFGSENFAWIEEDKIKPYVEFKESLEKTCKTVPFKEACAAIAEYKKRKDAGELVDEIDLKISSEYSEQAAADATIPGSSSPSQTKSSPAADSTFKDEPSPDSAPRPTSNDVSTTNTKVVPKRKKASAIQNGESPSSSSSRGTSVKKRRESSEPRPAKVRATSKQPASTKVVNNVNPVVRKSAATSLLNRPILNFSPPNAEPLNVLTISQTLKDKKITPSTLRFGFLGLGIMGAGMVKNLLNSGHRVMVWNRSPDKLFWKHDSFKKSSVRNPCNSLYKKYNHQCIILR